MASPRWPRKWWDDVPEEVNEHWQGHAIATNLGLPDSGSMSGRTWVATFKMDFVSEWPKALLHARHNKAVAERGSVIEALNKKMLGSVGASSFLMNSTNVVWEKSFENAHLMFLGNGLWLLDRQSLIASSEWRTWENDTMFTDEDKEHIVTGFPCPLLVHSFFPTGEHPVGTILRFQSPLRLNMVNCAGDVIHHTAMGTELYEKIETSDSRSERRWSFDYVIAGVASAYSIAKDNDELDDHLIEGLKEMPQFIPTYQDKRGAKTIDRTMGRAPVWHDEIRCQQCNGRVVLKFPRGNQTIEATCPHGIETPPPHTVQFPHLLDDRTFEEGEHGLGIVPKEAQ